MIVRTRREIDLQRAIIDDINLSVSPSYRREGSKMKYTERMEKVIKLNSMTFHPWGR